MTAVWAGGRGLVPARQPFLLTVPSDRAGADFLQKHNRGFQEARADLFAEGSAELRKAAYAAKEQ